MSLSSLPPESATVPVLVLSPRYSTDSRALRQAALQTGWQVERLGGWQAPERLFDRRLIFSGEWSYMKIMANSLSWALLDARPDWLIDLPLRYSKRTLQYMTLAQARELTESRFVKPATGKSFAAQVYPSGAHLPEVYQHLSEATPVLVSEPVYWEIEFRFFLYEHRVLTFSSYWRQDHLTLQDNGVWEAKPAEAQEAQDFMQTLLADPGVQIPPAIAIDIGKIRDRGWAVIESNAAWAAGIYGCDPLQVLPVLQRASVHRTHLSPGDVFWECNRHARRSPSK